MLAQRHRARSEPEQRDVRRLAQLVPERGVEAPDLVLGVAARCRQQADPRLARGASERTYSSSTGFSGSIVNPPPPIAKIVGTRPARRAPASGGKRAGSRLRVGAQVVDRERQLHDPAVHRVDADARAAGREETTRASDPPTKCSAAPSSAA